MHRAVRGHHALGHDALDRRRLHIDNLDIGLVIHLEVLAFQRHTVGAEAVGGRDELFAQHRVLQPLAHLLPHEFGHRLVHLFVEEHFRERRQPQRQRTVGPQALQYFGALRRRQVGPGTVAEVVFEAGEGVLDAVADFRETRALLRPVRRAVFRVAHRDDVLRRAQEHLQMAHLGRDGLDDLDAGGAGAHHAHPLADELDPLLRPACGVMDLPAERGLARKQLVQRRRQHAGAADQEACLQTFAAVGVHRPQPGRLVIARGGHPGIEQEVLAQVRPVGHVVQPALGFRLRRIALARLPVLEHGLIEPVLIDLGFGIEACPRVAVPVPGAAHAGGRLDAPHRKAQFAQPVHLVQPGHTGPDHDCVEGLHALVRPRRCGGRLCFAHHPLRFFWLYAEPGMAPRSAGPCGADFRDGR